MCYVIKKSFLTIKQYNMTQRKCVTKRPFSFTTGFLGIVIPIPVSSTNGIIVNKFASLSIITRLTPGFFLERGKIFSSSQLEVCL
jgi:hypothetical protein